MSDTDPTAGSRHAARVRSGVTLLALVGMLLLGVTWAWSAVTEPFPDRGDGAVCVPLTIEAGEKVFPDQVTVSVLNAGTRAGLAERTMGNLEDRGLARGSLGNAPPDVEVRNVQVWAEDLDDPAVRLVRSFLGKKATLVEREPLLPGVNLVVGDKFREVRKGRKSVVAKSDAQICSPPSNDL